MPVDDTQRRALSDGALVRPRPDLSTIVVTGDDRLSWLAGMLTTDVKSLVPGQAAFALSVNKTGKVQAEVWLLVETDQVVLGIPRDRDESLLSMLDHHLIMEDAELTLDRALSWWIAHGPAAAAVADAARTRGASVGIGTLGACPTAVVAVSRTADPNPAETLTLPEGAVLATPDAWRYLRVDALLPEQGTDYDDAYPQEARLEDLAVSFDKGCYLGQEAVFMLEKRGKPPRRLVLLSLAGAAPPAGAEVRVGDTKIGTVTTAVSHEGAALALAMVKSKHADVGASLTVDGRVAEVRLPTPTFHAAG